MFEGPTDLIKKAKKILILTHKDAGGDGDALGSLLGLSSAFSKLNIRTYPILSERIASNFSFLKGLEKLDKEIKEDVELIIFIDLADLKRACFAFEIQKLMRKVPSLLIDHHPRGDLYNLCNFKIHDDRASSTTEILYFLINSLRVPLDKEIATFLLIGMLTDTNSFQNPNTTPRTLEVASALLSCGVRVDQIVKNIFYDKPISILKLWGKAMCRIWKNKKYDILITALTQGDLLECKTSLEGANGIANFLSLSTKPPAKGILFLTEENGTIKGSLRTQRDEVDVSKLAKILGGGGHKKAAGFTLPGKLKIDDREWKII